MEVLLYLAEKHGLGIMYIVNSGDGHFVRFDGGNPLMDTDPLCATRMSKKQAVAVIDKLNVLGWVGELIRLVFAKMKRQMVWR